jgi:hypothetical protein
VQIVQSAITQQAHFFPHSQVCRMVYQSRMEHLGLISAKEIDAFWNQAAH